jgi:hypothetical protein
MVDGVNRCHDGIFVEAAGCFASIMLAKWEWESLK